VGPVHRVAARAGVETTWQLWLSGIERSTSPTGLRSLPQRLIRERVETRYLPMIEDTLANEVGSPVRGRLEVKNKSRVSRARGSFPRSSPRADPATNQRSRTRATP